MPAIRVKPGIHWIGVNDRTTDLFEGVWPITQEGVSYNSYLIVDQKKALVDLTKITQEAAFLAQLAELIDPSELDYIILNHMEPDHTGAIKILHELAPQATILGTAKCINMLAAFYGITERVKVVADGETLSLGEKTLTFVAVPFVHWPETMVTYESTERVLFSCDAFGGYGALRGAIFDDQCVNMDFYLRESLRYYANIVASFSGPVLKAIAKLGGTPIDVIAPSHGLVWRKNPSQVVELYQKWAEYATSGGEKGITLVYGSMYGNTEAVMNAVATGISGTGMELEIYDAARTHSSYILPSLWTRKGVMVGAPTYETGLFPPMSQLLMMAEAKRIGHKKVARFGSYGWSGGAQREFEKYVESLKWELTDTYEFQGGAAREALHMGEEFGKRFAELVAQA
jgi:anaerobic nitric oxide reductase flavorubredoxin